MRDLQGRSTEQEQGRALGWISGLGATIFPWIAAGIASTVAGVASEASSPEVTYPGFLIVAAVGMVAWLIYGSIRFPAFRKGAVYGGLISLGFAAAMYGLIVLLQP